VAFSAKGSRAEGALRRFRTLLGLAVAYLGFALIGPTSAAAQAPTVIDVTGLMRQFTTIDTDMAGLCDTACLGNQRRGSLVRGVLHVSPPPAKSLFVADIRLRSRQALFGTTVFDYSAYITVRLDVDLSSCVLTNPRISSSNDLYAVLIEIFERRLNQMAARMAVIC
jgi:hypothetical protein